MGYQPLPEHTGESYEISLLDKGWRESGMGILPHPYENPSPIEHIDFDSLPISRYTGLPYDPELISYPPGKPKPRREFRISRKREKAQPKQDHVSSFDVQE